MGIAPNSCDMILNFYGASPHYYSVLGRSGNEAQPKALQNPCILIDVMRDFGAFTSGQTLQSIFKSAAQARGLGGRVLGRVCLIGFSAGCSGIYQALRCSDAGNVDCVLGIDGVAGGYNPDNPKTGQLQMASAAPLIKFADKCSQTTETLPGSTPGNVIPVPFATPVCVITTSAIAPDRRTVTEMTPNGPKERSFWLASTTEVAQRIYTDLAQARGKHQNGMGAEQVQFQRLMRLAKVKYPSQAQPLGSKLAQSGVIGPDGYNVRYCIPGADGKCSGKFTNAVYPSLMAGCYGRKIVNNAWFLLWSNAEHNGPGYCDHVFQAQQILPEMVREFVVNRWNAQCGTVRDLGLESPYELRSSTDPQQGGGAAICIPGGGVQMGPTPVPLWVPGDEKKYGGDRPQVQPCPILPGTANVPTFDNPCNLVPVTPDGELLLGQPVPPPGTPPPPPPPATEPMPGAHGSIRESGELKIVACGAAILGGYYAVQWGLKTWLGRRRTPRSRPPLTAT